MLQDEDLDFIQKQYDEKNGVLAAFGEQVSASTLYEDIFGDLEIEVPVVILDADQDKHIVPMQLWDAIEKSAGRNDMLVGGCTYFKNWISKKTARDIYTLIIDMDNVYAGLLEDALNDDWYTATGRYLPKPTYIVNSGTGLHLYFVFTEPIPNYKSTTEQLDKLYRTLAVQQTTNRLFLKKQVQWFGQDFRMAGGLNKYEWVNTAFRIGDKWDADILAEKCGLPDLHFTRYGEPRVKTWRKSQADRGSREGWRSNRAFYDHTYKGCWDKTKEGNRYMSMCALAAIAWKCGVPRDELERDLRALLPKYNRGAKNLIKEKEVASAMKMYNSKAMLTQRETIENWQGWEFKPIKRNGRKRADHLKRARLVQTIDYPDGEWRNKNGRPKGSANKIVPKKELVLGYRTDHPDATVSEVARALQISRTTVYKWWNTEEKGHE